MPIRIAAPSKTPRVLRSVGRCGSVRLFCCWFILFPILQRSPARYEYEGIEKTVAVYMLAGWIVLAGPGDAHSLEHPQLFKDDVDDLHVVVDPLLEGQSFAGLDCKRGYLKILASGPGRAVLDRTRDRRKLPDPCRDGAAEVRGRPVLTTKRMISPQ